MVIARALLAGAVTGS